MLDLTEVELSEVTSAQLYALLLYFNESIVLKRNTIYTYTITNTPPATVAEPEPVPVDIDVYCVSLSGDIELRLSEIESQVPSVSYVDYGFTGERFATMLRGLVAFTDEEVGSLDLSNSENLIAENKYNFLAAVAISDLSFAKSIYYDAGIRYNWPEVTTLIKDGIEEIISSNEEQYDIRYTASLTPGNDFPLSSLMNDVRVSIYRLFEPTLIADEITF